MSRDLQYDFYPYFPRIFEKIVSLLETQDTEILEWSFQCLSYLFKFLWRYMLKDLENVYKYVNHLFRF
jgi:U3 small nucleolar RNA-associated protein 20